MLKDKRYWFLFLGLALWPVANASAPAYAATVIYRSVGPGNTVALANGAGNGLTIAANLATFSSPLPNNVGVGDIIQYDSNNDGTVDALAVISSRILDNSFNVYTPSGGVPANATGDQDWSIFRAYTSLANACGGSENTGILAGLRNFDTWSSSLDLVAQDKIWQIACYADAADTSSIFLYNWVTDAGHYIRIYTPCQTNEVGTSQRHNGKWTSTAYRMETGDTPLDIRVANVRVEGLQIKNTSMTADFVMGIMVLYTDTGTVDIRISHSILWGKAGGSYGWHTGIDLQGNNQSGVLRIWNNLVYDYTASGAFNKGIGISNIGSNAYVYNNTMHNCQTGLDTTGVSTVAKNNITQNCADGYSINMDGGSDYNLSDLAGDAPGSHSKNSTTVQFVDKDGDDFHLTAGDIGARDAGTDLSGDANLPFSDDIDGETRSGTWDMGADEQVTIGTPTPTATQSATFTHTPTETPSRTPTPTATQSATFTHTPTGTPTRTPTPTGTQTQVMTPSYSLTSTPSATPTSAVAATMTQTPGPSSTRTPLFPDALLFLPKTLIRISRAESLEMYVLLPQSGPVRLLLYDLTGRLAATLADGILPSGRRQITWNPENLGAGTYMVFLEAGGRQARKKVVLIR